MLKKFLAALLLFAASHAPLAFAEDTTPCPKGLICASAPQSVADAMMVAGYRAKMSTDDLGDPKISSAAAGYDFSIFFYGCKEHVRCDSLQFNITFTDDGKNTIALANDWNKKKWFAQMALLDDKRLEVRYDLATIGGVNQANFADVMAWWETTLGGLNAYFKEQDAAAKPGS
ncbi:hypothetical protein GGR44_000198 [Sphingobium fontiphilum]|uniref:YbjN domain-containing protein n=1 Tax=Sphingobium fontiphilum TaxID=944425 RepID=A0A7W6GMK5_9SPHN|nr:YbjN domain-containing protein [Sphingobium fontiphilum]MBB3980567.1 hypothetical protein [Sphingobium fontiphilum]